MMKMEQVLKEGSIASYKKVIRIVMKRDLTIFYNSLEW